VIATDIPGGDARTLEERELSRDAALLRIHGLLHYHARRYAYPTHSTRLPGLVGSRVQETAVDIRAIA
jgi:hypothetical protein